VFGIDFFDPQTMWLNITNLALGVVSLLCVLAVGWGVASELLARARKRAAVPVTDDHAFAVPGLGWTMADGGKKVDEKPEKGDS
jgi:hypothetical protein